MVSVTAVSRFGGVAAVAVVTGWWCVEVVVDCKLRVLDAVVGKSSCREGRGARVSVVGVGVEEVEIGGAFVGGVARFESVAIGVEFVVGVEDA